MIRGELVDLRPLTSADIERTERIVNDPDYNGAVFDAGQLARLTAVFPNGVCNWTLPGIGQANAELTTFKNSPDGMPMGPAPVSVPMP